MTLNFKFARRIRHIARPAACAGLSFIYFFTNVLCLYAGQSNFWTERKAAVKKLQNKSNITETFRSLSQAVPEQHPRTNISAEQSKLLAQLPQTAKLDLGVSENIHTDPTNIPSFSTGGEALSSFRKGGLGRIINNPPQSPFSKGGDRGITPTLFNQILPYGDIRDVYVSRNPNSPLIIHIQDVHQVEEAQKNIANALNVVAQFTRGELAESIERRSTTIPSFTKGGLGRIINNPPQSPFSKGGSSGLTTTPDKSGNYKPNELNVPVVVGLEGATGQFNMEPYREYTGPVIAKAIAGYLLKEGYIGGPEFAGFTAPEPPLLWGVENKQLYDNNVQAFKDSLKYKPQVEALLGQLKATAEGLKEHIYSKELKEFDSHFNAYKNDKEKLGNYCRYLFKTIATKNVVAQFIGRSLKHGTATTPDKSGNYERNERKDATNTIDTVKKFPNLNLLLQALNLEEHLDFNKVDKERQELVTLMVKQLSEKQLDHLLKESLTYRMGGMSYSQYYEFLRSFCHKNQVPFDTFNQLKSYVTYVKVAERINRNKLFDELTALEENTQNLLATIPEQKRLVTASRNLLLLEKLTSHQMTPHDWNYYKRNKETILSSINIISKESKVAAGFSLRTLKERKLKLATTTDYYNTQFIERRSNDIPATTPNELGNYITPFEDFCRHAMERNAALVENLLKKMVDERREKVDDNDKAAPFPPSSIYHLPSTISVLVAGGFHSDGLTQILKAKDISYVVVTPKITEVPKDTHYLDVFAHDPTPLEKLFTGEVISLAAPLTLAANSGDLRSRITRGLFAGLSTTADMVTEDQELINTNVDVTDQFKRQFMGKLQDKANKMAERIKKLNLDNSFQIKIEDFVWRNGYFVGALVNVVSENKQTEFWSVMAKDKKLNTFEKSLKEKGINHITADGTLDINNSQIDFHIYGTNRERLNAFYGLQKLLNNGRQAKATVKATTGKVRSFIKDAAPKVQRLNDSLNDLLNLDRAALSPIQAIGGILLVGTGTLAISMAGSVISSILGVALIALGIGVLFFDQISEYYYKLYLHYTYKYTAQPTPSAKPAQPTQSDKPWDLDTIKEEVSNTPPTTTPVDRLQGPISKSPSLAEITRAFKASPFFEQLLNSGRFHGEPIQKVDYQNMDAAIEAISELHVSESGELIAPEILFQIFNLINTERIFQEYAAVVGFEVIRGIALEKSEMKRNGELPANFLGEDVLPSSFRTWIIRTEDIGTMIDRSRKTPPSFKIPITHGTIIIPLDTTAKVDSDPTPVPFSTPPVPAKPKAEELEKIKDEIKNVLGNLQDDISEYFNYYWFIEFQNKRGGMTTAADVAAFINPILQELQGWERNERHLFQWRDSRAVAAAISGLKVIFPKLTSMTPGTPDGLTTPITRRAAIDYLKSRDWKVTETRIALYAAVMEVRDFLFHPIKFYADHLNRNRIDKAVRITGISLVFLLSWFVAPSFIFYSLTHFASTHPLIALTIPWLTFLSIPLTNIVTHGLFNLLVVEAWSITKFWTEDKTVQRALKQLLQDISFAEEIANHLNDAYNENEKKKDPNFTPYPLYDEETANQVTGLTNKEVGIGTNMAGFYALETALGALHDLPNRQGQTLVQILEDIENSHLTTVEKNILMRFANATWKATQPYRGLKRIARPVFTSWDMLSDQEKYKDMVQIREAAKTVREKLTGGTDNAQQEQILKGLLQDPSFAEQIANRLNDAYNREAGTDYPLYEAATAAKPSGLTNKESGIATNLAGFYGLEAGAAAIHELRRTEGRSRKSLRKVLEDVVNGRLTNVEQNLLMRFANATWKASQPFRGLAKRITKSNFIPWDQLPEAEKYKDMVQVKAAAEKLLEKLSPPTLSKGNEQQSQVESREPSDSILRRLVSLTEEINEAANDPAKADLKQQRTALTTTYVRRRLEKTNPQIATIVVRYIEDKERTDIQTLLLEGILTERIIQTLEEIARMEKDSLIDALLKDTSQAEIMYAVRRKQGRVVRRTQSDVDEKSAEMRRLDDTPFFPRTQWHRLQSDPEGFWKDYWKAESDWISKRKLEDFKWQRPQGPNADKVERENAAHVLKEVQALEDELDAFLRSVTAEARLSQEHIVNISHRTKGITSLLNKITNMRKAYKENDPSTHWAKDASIGDAVDLLGGRIVVNDLTSMEKILRAIEKKVAEWQINGRAGARILRTENKFLTNDGKPEPYRAIQFIIAFPGPDGRQHTFELQVKTFSSMIASDLFHNAVYKPDILNLHQALRKAVEDYNWASDYAEMDSYIRTQGEAVTLQEQVEAHKLSREQQRRLLIEKAIVEADYNAFYDLVLSRFNESVYRDKNVWIETYDWVSHFIQTEVELLKQLDSETLFDFAKASHDKGYWETKDVKGEVENPNSLQLGWDLPPVAYALLTEKGRASYDNRFENFKGSNNKLTTADLDLLSLDIPTRIQFFKAVKSAKNGGRNVKLSAEMEESIGKLTGEAKIMNLYHTSFDNLVAQGRVIRNPEGQAKWNQAIINNQIKAVALTAILTEIGGQDATGRLRDLAVPAPGAYSYTLREKLIHELWVFGDFHYNGEYAFDGTDRNGVSDPERWRKKDERASITYAEFVEKYPTQRDLDKTIDTSVLATIAERKLQALRASMAITDDPVLLARLVQDLAVIIEKYIRSLTNNGLGEALSQILSDKYYAQIRVLLDNGTDGERLAKDIVGQARKYVQTKLPVTTNISAVIAAVTSLAGLSEEDVLRLTEVTEASGKPVEYREPVESQVQKEIDRLNSRLTAERKSKVANGFIMEKLKAIESQNPNYAIVHSKLMSKLSDKPRDDNEDEKSYYALLEDAYKFAVAAHGDQQRKDKVLEEETNKFVSTPYMVHLLGVASLLINESGVNDIHYILAAFMHDTLEDHPKIKEAKDKAKDLLKGKVKNLKAQGKPAVADVELVQHHAEAIAAVNAKRSEVQSDMTAKFRGKVAAIVFRMTVKQTSIELNELIDIDRLEDRAEDLYYEGLKTGELNDNLLKVSDRMYNLQDLNNSDLVVFRQHYLFVKHIHTLESFIYKSEPLKGTELKEYLQVLKSLKKDIFGDEEVIKGKIHPRLDRLTSKKEGILAQLQNLENISRQAVANGLNPVVHQLNLIYHQAIRDFVDDAIEWNFVREVKSEEAASDYMTLKKAVQKQVDISTKDGKYVYVKPTPTELNRNLQIVTEILKNGVTEGERKIKLDTIFDRSSVNWMEKGYGMVETTFSSVTSAKSGLQLRISAIESEINKSQKGLNAIIWGRRDNESEQMKLIVDNLIADGLARIEFMKKHLEQLKAGEEGTGEMPSLFGVFGLKSVVRAAVRGKVDREVLITALEATKNMVKDNGVAHGFFDNLLESVKSGNVTPKQIMWRLLKAPSETFLILPSELFEVILKAAGFAFDNLVVAAGNDSLYQEAKGVVEQFQEKVGTDVKPENIHIVRGPPVKGLDNKKFVTFAPDAKGALHVYIHKDTLRDWEREERRFTNNPPQPSFRKGGEKGSGYLRNTLTMALWHETLENRGVSHDDLADMGFTIDALNEMYKAGLTAEQIHAEIMRRGMMELSHLVKVEVQTSPSVSKKEKAEEILQALIKGKHPQPLLTHTVHVGGLIVALDGERKAQKERFLNLASTLGEPVAKIKVGRNDAETREYNDFLRAVDYMDSEELSEGVVIALAEQSAKAKSDFRQELAQSLARDITNALNIAKNEKELIALIKRVSTKLGLLHALGGSLFQGNIMEKKKSLSLKERALNQQRDLALISHIPFLAGHLNAETNASRKEAARKMAKVMNSYNEVRQRVVRINSAYQFLDASLVASSNDIVVQVSKNMLEAEGELSAVEQTGLNLLIGHANRLNENGNLLAGRNITLVIKDDEGKDMSAEAILSALNKRVKNLGIKSDLTRLSSLTGSLIVNDQSPLVIDGKISIKGLIELLRKERRLKDNQGLDIFALNEKDWVRDVTEKEAIVNLIVMLAGDLAHVLTPIETEGRKQTYLKIQA